MIGLMVLVGVFVASISLPTVEAKPFTDKNTGITVHCKVIQGATSCDVSDRKSGIYLVLLTNNSKLELPIEGECSSKVTTPIYEIVTEQGPWTLVVTNCNADGQPGNTSIFNLVLGGNKFSIME